MILKLLSKKYVMDILYLLDEHGELGYSEIWKLVLIGKGLLSRILKELEGEKIVSRREERQDRRIPRAYYSLTPYGKEIVNACKILDDIESRKSSLLMEL